MAAHRQSSYVALTRALLTGGATLALARVYSGSSWLAPLIAAAVLPAAIFAVGERRRANTYVTLGGALVVGAWLAVVVDDPSETFAGLPTAASLAGAAHDLARAPHVLRSAVVPVDPVGAALVLAVVATFVAALGTELVARRLEAPIGAIGPSVALYIAISALGAGRWAPTTACYAFVVAEYLVALHRCEIETRRTWFQTSRRRRSQLVTGGAMAGAFVIALAIAFGPFVPGARGSAWIRYRSLGTGGGSNILNVTSPLVSVRAKLSGKDSTTEVFTVRTTEAKGDYWRVIALDQFQDDGWGLNSDQRSAASLPGPTHAPGTTMVSQTFHLAAIDARWLPAAYRPVRIDVPGSQVLPGSTSLFLDNPLSGLAYNVQSEVSNPDRAVLESVTVDDLQAMAADEALPDTFSSRARAYAQSVTKNARTPYDQALALMKVFQSSPFVYDTSVNLGTTADALDRFLFETHRGFCEQFASAFAELARSIGLPTRVAVGYQRGTLGSDGLWHVREKDAHAWPEVWLGPKVGWYRFEPTPGARRPRDRARREEHRGRRRRDHDHDTARERCGDANDGFAHAHIGPVADSGAAAGPAAGIEHAPPRPDGGRRGTRDRDRCARRTVGPRRTGRVAPYPTPAARSRRPATRARRVDRSTGTPDSRGRRTATVHDLSRVRAATGSRARRGSGRTSAHGPGAAAHGGAVLARATDAGRRRQGMVGGRRHHRRAAGRGSALTPLAGPVAVGTAFVRTCHGGRSSGRRG